MDYILFGAGTGASLAVIGWILREWGPRLRDGKSDDDVIYSASELIDRMSWARFCASCGMAMVVAGTLILLATAIVTAWNPGDELAARILIGMYLFVSLLLLVWAYLYTRQFGTSGIYRPITVEPVSDTREAVAVTERESPETDGKVPMEGDSDAAPEAESPSEPQRDFAEVAASRGGLGRFASFFNRQRPADPIHNDGVDEGADREDVQVEIDDDRVSQELQDSPEELEVESSITEADLTVEDGPERVEAQETVVTAKSDDEVVEVIDTVEVTEVEESAGIASDAVATEADASGTEDRAERADPVVESSAGDTSPDSTTGEPAAVVTPEDDALAELRRRRLARLSGGNQ